MTGEGEGRDREGAGKPGGGEGGEREEREGGVEEGGEGRGEEDSGEGVWACGEGVGRLGGSATGTIQDPAHLGCVLGRAQGQVAGLWGVRRRRGEERKGGGSREEGRRGVGESRRELQPSRRYLGDRRRRRLRSPVGWAECRGARPKSRSSWNRNLIVNTRLYYY